MARQLSSGCLLGALACGLLAAGAAGCRESSERPTAASGTVGANGVTAAGPDVVVGEGTHAVVIPGVNTLTPPAGLPSVGEKLPSDFILSNGFVTLGIDAVGLDTSSSILNVPQGSLSGTITDGVPIENTVAPSGGNLVDISIVGAANDQWVTNGIGFVGASIAGGFGAYTPPDNLVFWFEVIPDTSTRTATIGIHPVPGQTIHRLICRGVILNNNSSRAGVNEAVDGASTELALDVKTTSVAPQAIPPAFHANVPDVFRILCHTSGGGAVRTRVPIFVTQIYTLFEGSPIITETTVVQHAIPGGDPVRIGQAAEFTGVGAAGNASLDVLAGGPMWVDPLAVLTAALGSEPAAQATLNNLVGAGLLPARPSVTAGELNRALRTATGKPAFASDSFGRGVVPWVSFVGRGEPAVSYTLFDPLAGGIVFNRDPRFAGIGLSIQLRSDPTIPSDNPATTNVNEAAVGRLAWARKIAVGRALDAASSSDQAALTMRAAPRAATFTPNTVFDVVTLEGRLEGAPEGTIVTIHERAPTFFSNFSPNTAVPDAAPGPTNPPVMAGPGLPVPLAPFSGPLAGFPPRSGVTLAADVLRTTVRPNGGRWQATLPVGARFQFIDPFNPFTPPTTLHDDPTSEFVIFARLPGGATPVTITSSLVVSRGTYHRDLGTTNVSGAVGFVSFRIVDDASNAPIPGTVTILTPAGDTPVTDFSFPTGIEEGLERTRISGNTAMTASGSGVFALRPGVSFRLIGSAGFAYETDTHASVSVAPGGTTPVEFRLTKVHPVAADAGRTFVQADFHVHAGESPDSSVPPADRIRSLLAQGIEVFAQTEHDKIGDLTAAIAAMRSERSDISSRLFHMHGVEFTTDLPWLPGSNPAAARQCIGHFNAYPLQYRPGFRKGGAPEDELRPAGIAFVNIRLQDGVLANPDTTEIIQLNHPRSATSTSALDGGDGYLSNLAFAFPAFGPGALAAPFGDNDAPGSAPVPISSVGIQMLIDGLPTIAATGGGGSPFAPLGPAATVLRGSMEFDTIEIMNGSQDFRRFLQHRADWFSMLNRGVIKTAVGTSDAHRVDDRRSALDDRFDHMHVGIARSFILTSAGPAQLSNAAVMNLVKPSYRTPAVLSGLPTALNAFGTLAPATRTADRQRVIVTTGPMINVSVSGAGVSGTLTNPIGRAVTATGDVDIEVTVTGPSWILEHATEARLVVNGILLTRSLSAGTTSKSATFTDVDLSTGPDGPHSEDTWVVVEAGQPLADVASGVLPTGEYAQIYPGIPVFALTNPIFFDRDGNIARFDAVRNDE